MVGTKFSYLSYGKKEILYKESKSEREEAKGGGGKKTVSLEIEPANVCLDAQSSNGVGQQAKFTVRSSIAGIIFSAK